MQAPTPLHEPKSLADVIVRFTQADEQNVIGTIVDILLSEELTNQYCDVLGPQEGLLRDAGIPGTDFARGATLYLAFHHVATLPEITRDVDFLNRVARDDDFVLFFRKFYAIPDAVELRSLSFHASGTTSFIFKAVTEKHGQCALKVIQAPYVRLAAIQIATAAYARTFGHDTDFSPKVYRSAALWILMELIQGKNLHEYLNQLREKEVFLSDAYISSVANVFHLIARALAYYERLKPPIIHGDLTPLNIMVEFEDGDPVGVKLIDFGPNYVLKDRLGSRRTFVEAFSKTELFTAPEVVSGASPTSIQSDYYSLGMIGLDMLCDKPLRKDAVGVRLREIWQNPASIGIAQIIEDLIDENPDNRLLILKIGKEESVYAALDTVLQDHVKLYKDVIFEPKSSRGFMKVMFTATRLDVIKSALSIGQISKLDDRSYNNITKSQRLASGLNLICLLAIVMSFAFYTYIDFRAAFFPTLDFFFPQFLVDLPEKLPKNFRIGDFYENLPGRAVALTFGLIAARYYANIFAPLRVALMPGFLQFFTNFLLRANCVTYFVPIMAAIVYDPKLWPFCALFGTIFPALNNFFCWLTAREARIRTGHLFSLETYHHEESKGFLREYREWWLLMLSYSLVIGAIGTLLFYDFAKDEKIYAALVCFINMGKIYRNNCGREAPKIAGNLSRMFFSIRRWSAKQARPSVSQA